MLNFTTPEDQLLQAALQHHQAGRLQQAEGLYRQVLQRQPDHPGALHLMGVLAGHANRPEIALEFLHQALAAKPDFPEAWLDLGNAHQAQGNLAEAIADFRRAVALRPDFAAAHNNLGNALQANGQSEESLIACHQALAIKPDFAEAHNNLGNALQAIGRLDEAVAAYQQALALKPDFAVAMFNLGNVLRTRQQVQEAIDCFRRALALQPRFAEAHFNLGSALQAQGRTDEAIACYQQAVTFKPDLFDGFQQLGALLQERGRLDEAIAAFRQARQLRPEVALIHNQLGAALKARGFVDEAIASFRDFLALRPDDPLGHNNLGAALADTFQTEQAIVCYQRALDLDPTYMAAHVNLGNAYKDQGLLDETIACFRRAMALAPDSALVHSKLAYTLVFHPDGDQQRTYEECRRWNQQHAAPLKKLIEPHTNDRTPDRPLRIGYVSPDFCNHVVGRFLLPLLDCHDHANFHITCYADVPRPDEMTQRMQGCADQWRSILGQSDQEAADLIRQDRIDLLIDLSLHMAGNRLLVFARKPAPVQVSWLGYPGTTGLDAIDYRITDPYLDPPGLNDAFYSEKSVRVPDTCSCYQLSMPTPPVNALPAQTSGYVTFGCLNNFCKISPTTFAVWIKILHAVPQSHLLLHAYEGLHRQRAAERFAHAGIDPARIAFVGFGGPRYYEFYHRIDLVLDPFPYGGGTTTCDSLWMGVPVLTLAGNPAFARMGLSILSNIGQPELISHDQEQYVQMAVALATDLPRLAALRSTLRQQMQSSPMMDAPRFARNMEAAYRQMWQAWCATSP